MESVTFKVAGKNIFVGILGINGVPTLISSDGINDLTVNLTDQIKELCVFDFSNPDVRLFYWNTLTSGNLRVTNSTTSEVMDIDYPDVIRDNISQPNICLQDMQFRSSITCQCLIYQPNLQHQYVLNPAVLTSGNPINANQNYWNSSRIGVQKKIVIIY